MPEGRLLHQIRICTQVGTEYLTLHEKRLGFRVLACCLESRSETAVYIPVGAMCSARRGDSERIGLGMYLGR